jgi:hypothetical protein
VTSPTCGTAGKIPPYIWRLTTAVPNEPNFLIYFGISAIAFWLVEIGFFFEGIHLGFILPIYLITYFPPLCQREQLTKISILVRSSL